MTTEGRKIQLETSVDPTGAKAGFQQVKDGAKDMAQSVAQSGQQAAKGLDGIGEGAGAASAKVDRATSNLIGSIQRATAAAEAGKKGGSAFFESLANQRGVNVDVLRPYLDQLDAATAKTKAATSAAIDFSKVTTSLGASTFQKPLGNPTTSLGATAFGSLAAESKSAAAVASQSLGKVEMSAKQTAAALRGVPAQFTDIITSLQGGQAPLTVLLQQGGQLKDMFGGIGPAARALGGYIGSLINPFTLAAGAVALLGAAFYTATSRTQEFNKALITTGDYVGKTAGDLNDLAKSIASSIGTQGQASDALTALAGSGKIAGDSLRAVGEAVVAQNKAMGTSIEDAVAQFVKLADEPTKASAKLNDSLHYLNQTTYDRIRALEDQGNKEAAAALAQDTYAKATVERMNQVIAQSGLLSKALSGTKDVALGMWNAIAGGLASIGAQQTAAEKLVDAQRKVKFLEQNGSTPEALAKARGDVASLSREALRQQENAFAQGERARNEAAKIAATDRLATLSKEIETNADKRRKAIEKINKDFKELGTEAAMRAADGKTQAELIAAAEAKFKDPKAAGAKAFQDDAATKMLESLRQQEAALKEQLNTDEKLTASEKERAKFVQLVADLKIKGTLTAEQKSLLLNQEAIKAQLDKNVAVEAEIKAKEDAVKLAEKQLAFEKQMQAITLSYQSSNQSRAEQYDRTLSTVGLGARARQEVESEKQIRREFDRFVLQANKQAADASTDKFDAFGTEAYKKQIAELQAAREDELQKLREFYAAEKAARENWLNGATSALADYIDYVEDAAGRTRALMGTLLGGGTDALTEFFWSGGKNLDAAKKFGDQLGKQIIQGIVEQQLTKPFAEWLQGALTDKDSLISKTFGGLMSNKDTGENWLGFLGLGGTSGKQAANDTFARGSSIANPLYVKSVDFGFGSAANDSGGGIVDLLGGLFSGSSTGVAASVANNMSGDSLDNFLQLMGMFGGAFADGGSPPLGKVSLVGERGPELFVPRQAGAIVPNHALGGGMRGGDTFNISVEGQVSQQTRRQMANDLALEQRQGKRYA